MAKCKARSPRPLGVSVMTPHRWRKLDRLGAPEPSAAFDLGHDAWGERGQADVVPELLMENRRLRQIVTDLLRERIKLEEAAGLRAP